MKLSTKIISTLSATAIAMSVASPALAYVTGNDDAIIPTVSEKVSANSKLHNRPITSREIVRAFHRNVFINPQVRGIAMEDNTGRIHLPVRNAWRHPGLRNQNRHVLGNERGGTWGNAAYYLQGDKRRSGSFRSKLANIPESLPPRLIQTGADNKIDRPTRRDIRGDRDLNDFNRR